MSRWLLLLALFAAGTAQAQHMHHHPVHPRHRVHHHRLARHVAHRHVVSHRIVPAAASADLQPHAPGPRGLLSDSVLVVDQESGQTLYGKNADKQRPIASITKLMNAMVLLDAHLPMDQPITVTEADVDRLRYSASRLPVGITLPRWEMLQLALMASENRAAAALARTYPGGTAAFVAAMNRKARELRMWHSHFADPTGLNDQDVSTAEDLVKMVNAAYQYDTIRRITTTTQYHVAWGRRGGIEYHNTDLLVRNGGWNIGLSKTGFINEAGHCLVLQTRVKSRPVIMVLLDSWGRFSRIGDAERVRRWLEATRS